MRTRIFPLVVVCLLCLFSAKAQNVNEAETRAFIANDKLQTDFIIENKTDNFSGKIRVELLNLDDTIVSQTEMTASLKNGKQTFSVGVSLPENYRNSQILVWHRLRYSIVSFDEREISGGIISLSEIIPDLFEFRAAASNQLYAGINYIVRVRASHPTKENLISGVKIKAQLNAYLKSSKTESLTVESNGETDAEGYATLSFKIPNEAVFANNWSGTVKISGEKNGLTGELSQSLYTISDSISMFLNTDKPIYQPGQKFYVRGLALRRGILDSSTTIAAEKDLEFIIKDEDDTILYRQKVKTSAFGIAAIEWQIPDNAKLGTYKVQIKSDENLTSDQTTFKVSRYELPNFVVNAKAAKEFYLPGENLAEITVDGTYLFGKTVAAGKVRVVRETGRNWNYKAQKWESQEEKTYEGKTNAEGKYIVKVDLSETQNDLRYENNLDFEDVRFAAYLTDSSTNRTEQRRFDVRVSRKPIHVYLIGNTYRKINPKMPLRYFVTTFSADGFIEVDKSVIAGINKFLISRQNENGSWTQKYAANETEDFQRTKIITTYIARVLSMKKLENADDEAALKKAFAYLKEQNAAIDEPYALANFALSLQNAGEFATANSIIERLKKLAITESDTIYWNLETNTPFYGWGTPGRIETTALVVQTLIKSKTQNPKSEAETDELISKGTQFLLKNKDRYGVWYSTQTTINVLDALIAALAGSNFSDDSLETKAEILVNGQKLPDVALPSPKTLGFPISIDISKFLQPTQNKVEVKIDGNAATMMLQIVANHYVSWQDAELNAANTNASRQVKLEYSCDKLNAQIAEEITCSVTAERVGFRGYGMLLAEIGLPPGADVDRASLEKAKNDNWSFSRYDVLPDKIIVYMRAYADGTNFNFKFKPRYGISANSASSSVYDYYNEEAKAILAPLKFNVK
jgi:A-macroglobulin TED domain/MG2 domain/A-macroglobulin receptor binding domain/Macroglobulin domain MG3